MSDRKIRWRGCRSPIAEAALSTGSDDDADLVKAWSYLQDRLGDAAQMVESDPGSRNRVDIAAGMRHLLVLLSAGIDEVLRFDPDPILRVERTTMNDVVSWGMECPDCIYTRAALRGGESHRLFGNRGPQLRRPADDERHRGNGQRTG